MAAFRRQHIARLICLAEQIFFEANGKTVPAMTEHIAGRLSPENGLTRIWQVQHKIRAGYGAEESGSAFAVSS